jgi:hypothetical protein
VSISAEDREFLLDFGGTVVDLESGREGTVLALGCETALVNFGPLLGSAWVPFGELDPGRLP